jgi:DNA-binding NarL/FixJ family response regulator
VKVIVVDDHDLFRKGVRQTLALMADCRVVGEAGSARDAFILLDRHHADLVLMDLGLPGMDGVVATREILRRSPSTRVLILSFYDDLRDVLDAFNAGASGYALKAESSESLEVAVKTVARGDRYLAPALALRLATYQGHPQPADLLDILSEREREVFRLAAECMLAREISRELCISHKTVDTHLRRIHRKLGLRNITELVRMGMALGLSHRGRLRSGRSDTGPGAPGADAGATKP